MFKSVLLLFLIGHLLGDFYLQSNKLALAKDVSFKQLLKHGFIYLCSMLIVVIPVFNVELVSCAVVISLIHFIIDFIKYLMKTMKPSFSQVKYDYNFYLLDQFAHIVTIILVWIILYLFSKYPIQYLNIIQFIINDTDLDIVNLLSWLFILLLITKPFSITIKKVLYCYRPINSEIEDGHANAGALIGILERLIILLFLSVGQYSAIGFVLTAKSIARYNKIADDPMFSEYYLLGTLLSALLVILSYLIVF